MELKRDSYEPTHGNGNGRRGKTNMFESGVRSIASRLCNLDERSKNNDRIDNAGISVTIGEP